MIREILCALATSGVSFFVGVYFSQPVKDWIAGIPAAARAEVAKVEAELVAKIKSGL